MCWVVPMRPAAPLRTMPMRRRSAITVQLPMNHGEQSGLVRSARVALEIASALSGVVFGPVDYLSVCREPNIPFGFGVPDQLVEYPDA